MDFNRTHWWEISTLALIDELQNSRQIQEAAEALNAGELVAFPTETVYG